MWYKNFLSAYEKPYDTLPQTLLPEINKRITALQSPNPVVSVVVIAYNEEVHLPACLWSLSESRCKYPMEIIGIDNNSSDRTGEIFQRSGVIFQKESRKGHGNARNCGLDLAKGQYYLCIDSDTLYPPRYVETMVDALKKPGIVGVYGLWSFIGDGKNSRFSIKLYEFMRDVHLTLKSVKRPERAVRGMVFGINGTYARQIRFRTDLKRGEDGSMAYALKKYGKLRFMRSVRVRTATSLRSVAVDGSLFNAFRVRFWEQLKNIKLYFIKKRASELFDDESNLLK